MPVTRSTRSPTAFDRDLERMDGTRTRRAKDGQQRPPASWISIRTAMSASTSRNNGRGDARRISSAVPSDVIVPRTGSRFHPAPHGSERASAGLDALPVRHPPAPEDAQSEALRAGVRKAQPEHVAPPRRARHRKLQVRKPASPSASRSRGLLRPAARLRTTSPSSLYRLHLQSQHGIPGVAGAAMISAPFDALRKPSPR